MIIGFLSIEIYFPYSHSLKEKRKILNSLKDRLKNRYNVALAELNYHNKWQRTKIGIVTINNQKKVVEILLHKILFEIEENICGQVIDNRMQYF